MLSLDKIPAILIGGPLDGLTLNVPARDAGLYPVRAVDSDGGPAVYRAAGRPVPLDEGGRLRYLYRPAG